MPDATTTTVLVDDPADDEETRLYVGAWLASYSSAKTREAYAYDIDRWVGWCRAAGLHPFRGLKRAQVQLYARHMEDLGLAKATRERGLSTLSGWLRWLCDEDIIGANPAANVRRPRRDTESATQGLTRTESADWLAAGEAEGGYPFALACLLLMNGLRIGEINRARVADLGSSNYHHTLTVYGKGDKVRTAALAPITRHAIDQALDGRAEGPLLLNQADRAMTKKNAAFIVRRLSRKARIDKTLSPHSLRHSFITQALNAGVPLRDVQYAAGHASIQQTMRYDRARESLNRHATYTVAQWVSSAA